MGANAFRHDQQKHRAHGALLRARCVGLTVAVDLVA